MRRIIWRAARTRRFSDQIGGGGEREKKREKTHTPQRFVGYLIRLSASKNPTGLTCPNARSTLTDRLACLRGGGGGGKKGTWMNGKKNPHPPTGRQGALTERDSSRLFLRGGRYRVPFSTSSLLLLSEFQGPPDSDLWTPRRSILPPFNRRRRKPPHHHHHPPTTPPPPPFSRRSATLLCSTA